MKTLIAGELYSVTNSDGDKAVVRMVIPGAGWADVVVISGQIGSAQADDVTTLNVRQCKFKPVSAK